MSSKKITNFNRRNKKNHNTKLIIKSAKLFTAQSNIKITPKYATYLVHVLQENQADPSFSN